MFEHGAYMRLSDYLCGHPVCHEAKYILYCKENNFSLCFGVYVCIHWFVLFILQTQILGVDH